MASQNVRAESQSTIRIEINEPTWSLLNDVQADFQTAGTLVEALDHFLDESQSYVGGCATEKQPERAADANLHAMIMLEQLRRHLTEAELKFDGAMLAMGTARAASRRPNSDGE